MRLARVNSVLLAAIIIVNGYLLVMPFVPNLVYWWQDRWHAPVSTRALAQKVASKPSPSNPLPADNELIVPAMHLDDRIIEGKDLSALKYGPWRRPNASTPDKGGNTVIVGHRFTYTNPRGTFYELDKVHVGNQIAVIWQGKKYTYQVSSIKEVAPDSVGIEAPTANPQLTLYTCTPLWLPKDRLVVVANLLGVTS